MSTEVKQIQIKTGNKADLTTANLLPGEEVLALDTNEVGIKTAGGNMIWFTNYNDLISHTANTSNPHAVTAAQLGVADYIIEQGISGSWYYRKYNSGKAECWCIWGGNITGAGPAASFFGGYKFTKELALPFQFAAAPTCSYTAVVGGDVAMPALASSTVSSVTLVAISGYLSGTQAVRFHVIVIGKIS